MLEGPSDPNFQAVQNAHWTPSYDKHVKNIAVVSDGIVIC